MNFVRGWYMQGLAFAFGGQPSPNINAPGFGSRRALAVVLVFSPVVFTLSLELEA